MPAVTQGADSNTPGQAVLLPAGEGDLDLWEGTAPVCGLWKYFSLRFWYACKMRLDVLFWTCNIFLLSEIFCDWKFRAKCKCNDFERNFVCSIMPYKHSFCLSVFVVSINNSKSFCLLLCFHSHCNKETQTISCSHCKLIVMFGSKENPGILAKVRVSNPL